MNLFQLCMTMALLLLTSLVAAVEQAPGKVLFLVEKGFNRGEYYVAHYGLRALGYQTDIASTKAGLVTTATKAYLINGTAIFRPI